MGDVSVVWALVHSNQWSTTGPKVAMVCAFSTPLTLTIPGEADEQQTSWWLGAVGSCPVLGADGGFPLIILV